MFFVVMFIIFFFSSRRRHTRFALVTGVQTCALPISCHRPWDHEESPRASAAIADYLLLMEGKAGQEAARHRLNQVLDYIEATNPETVCAEIDELWIDAFRRWALEQPVQSPKGVVQRERSLAPEIGRA